MLKKITSFGFLLPLALNEQREVVVEKAYFERNRKPHHHKQWEICYVLSGTGRIIVQYQYGKHTFEVSAGQVIEIPPNTDHWMEVDFKNTMTILLVYSTKNFQFNK